MAEFKCSEAREFVIESCRLFANTIQEANTDLHKRGMDKLEFLSKFDENAFRSILQNCDQFCRDIILSIDYLISGTNTLSGNSELYPVQQIKPETDTGTSIQSSIDLNKVKTHVMETLSVISNNENIEMDNSETLRNSANSQTRDLSGSSDSPEHSENIDLTLNLRAESIYDMDSLKSTTNMNLSESPSVDQLNNEVVPSGSSKSPVNTEIQNSKNVDNSEFQKKQGLIFENMLGCSECGMIFPSKDTLMEHTLLEHGKKLRQRKDGKNWKCQTCGLLFQSRDFLRNHTRTVHGVRSNVPMVSISSKSADEASEFSLGAKSKKAGKDWRCEICDIVFGSRDSLIDHTRLLHVKPTSKHIPPRCDNMQGGKSMESVRTFDNVASSVGKEQCEVAASSLQLRQMSMLDILETHAPKLLPIAPAIMDQSLTELTNDADSVPAQQLSLIQASRMFGVEEFMKDSLSHVMPEGFPLGNISSALDTPVRSDSVDPGQAPPVTLDGKIRKRRPNFGTVWKCVKCGIVFKYRAFLRAHMKEFHRGKRQQKRRKHASKRSNKSALDVRVPEFMKPSNDVNSVEYEPIQNTTVTVDETNQTLAANTGKVWRCQICNITFQSRDNLRSHTKHNHAVGLAPTRSEVDESLPSVCHYCGIVFKTLKKYHSHLATHTKPHKCNLCEKRFAQRYMLARHELLHTGEKPHKCDLCERAFYRKFLLKTHIDKDHSAVRFNCDQCSKTFVSNDNLRYHFMRAHTNQRPHSCNVCGKGFVKKLELKYHQAQHTNLRDFKCSQCTATFYNKISLNKHKTRIHSSEKHICHICAKEFHHHTRLTLHMRVHTGERNYKCHVCGQDFRWAGNLRKHVARHTEGPRKGCQRDLSVPEPKNVTGNPMRDLFLPESNQVPGNPMRSLFYPGI